MNGAATLMLMISNLRIRGGVGKRRLGARLKTTPDGSNRQAAMKAEDGLWQAHSVLSRSADQTPLVGFDREVNKQEGHPERNAGRDADDFARRKVFPFRLCDVAVSDSGLGACLCVSDEETFFLNSADIALEFRLVAQLDGYFRVDAGAEFCDAVFHLRGQRRLLLLFRLGQCGRCREEGKQQRADEKQRQVFLEHSFSSGAVNVVRD